MSVARSLRSLVPFRFAGFAPAGVSAVNTETESLALPVLPPVPDATFLLAEAPEVRAAGAIHASAATALRNALARRDGLRLELARLEREGAALAAEVATGKRATILRERDNARSIREIADEIAAIERSAPVLEDALREAAQGVLDARERASVRIAQTLERGAVAQARVRREKLARLAAEALERESAVTAAASAVAWSDRGTTTADDVAGTPEEVRRALVHPAPGRAFAGPIVPALEAVAALEKLAGPRAARVRVRFRPDAQLELRQAPWAEAGLPGNPATAKAAEILNEYEVRRRAALGR
jgi:hypothetical protein